MAAKNAAIVVLVLAILLAGGWWFLNNRQTLAPSPSPTQTPTLSQVNESTTSTGLEESASGSQVSISATGFSQKDIKIKAGEKVTWTNQDSAMHNVSSAVHPTHQVYPPLNLGNISAGESKSLIFPDKGIYKYHDHLNPSLFGSVTVE